MTPKLALSELDRPGGFAVIVGVGGGVVSTANTDVTGELGGVLLPRPSVARMWSVYWPSVEGKGIA